MANIPGTSGPVDYPNRPEGDGGNLGGPSLPGGSARAPEAAPDAPGPQQGAGSGSGGLYPNPGESASGSVVTGWKGTTYASAAPPMVDSRDGKRVGENALGDNRGGGLSTPDTFTVL